MRALVRLLPGVDLPVPVEAAGVGQHLAAVLARHTRLAVGSDLPGLDSPLGGPLPHLCLLGRVWGRPLAPCPCTLKSPQNIEPRPWVGMGRERGGELVF